MAAGLYIHIPFCISKCPYCDFYSVKYESELAKKYVLRLAEEFKKYKGSEFDTVYFGGGTPSALEPELICRIIDEARNNFVISPKAEITVECNPSKDLKEDFRLYAESGVNRLSIGMQSAVDKERFALGRRAGQAEVKKTVEYAKNAGISNISLDVMLGTPKQSIDSLDTTFDFIDKAGVTHISAYMLKIEEGTPFFKLQDRLALPDEDTVSQMYLKTIKILEQMGFCQYEISNFAKPGYESRHNTKYWTLEPYLGIGPSAHSFWEGKRFYYDKNWNIVSDGFGGDTEEKIMLGMRLTKGIDKSLINKDISQFLEGGYLKINGSNVAFTPKGMLISNYILSEII